ncbi:MAG: prepilin peptidase [Rubrivivax sp.]|nr:prepilin peptidase [Rubrivivax sp.]MCL4699969.1 A24 family peptidase [Burkholderiaceae bacterium]
MAGAPAAAAAADWMVLLFSPWALALLGLCIGSFLNVVVHRLPTMYMRGWWAFDIADFALADKRSWRSAFGAKAEPPVELAAAAGAINRQLEASPPLSLTSPRSRCPHCGHTLRVSENVPVLSWLVLRGRCSACRAPIGLRYPLVEAATAVLFALCAVVFGPGWMALVACIAVALLLAMALIDLDYTLLPDSLTIPLVVLGLVAALAGISPVAWRDAAAGALVGYGVLWALGVIWAVLLRKPNAMAEGDMKMLAGLGALLGWQVLPGILLVAAGLGSVIGIGLIVFAKHKRETPIPFGPYLALGGVLALLMRERFVAPVEDMLPMLGG